MWNSLGSVPDPTELEVTVLGPGYGESVVVHLGNERWLIVDSCVDSKDPPKPSAPLRYLRQLGVRVEEAVKLVVVSHWDDDHVRGIADVLEASRSARFVCSHVFPDKKFVNFVEALSVGSAATDGANVREMRKVLQLLESRNEPIRGAIPGRQLYSDPLVRTWSPSDSDANEFLKYLAQMHPKAGMPLRRAIPSTANLTSVVLSVDWKECSVLLGADMERSSDPQRGWSAVISETQHIGHVAADLVKVPHHGSENGDDDRMWELLLKPNPTSVIAPFGKGILRGRPPKSSDIRRINHRSGQVYLTARHDPPENKRKMDVAVTRSLREGSITLAKRNSNFGIVRSRRQSNGQWHQELFGDAIRVK